MASASRVAKRYSAISRRDIAEPDQIISKSAAWRENSMVSVTGAHGSTPLLRACVARASEEREEQKTDASKTWRKNIYGLSRAVEQQ